MSEQFEKSIRTLELPRVLQLLSEQAVSAEGKARCLRIRPETEAEEALRLLDQTDAARAMIGLRGSPSFSGVKPVAEALDRADRGGSLNTRELLSIADLLTAARRAKEYFSGDDRTEKTAIDHLFLSLHGNRFLEETIKRCIPDEDTIADAASPELADIRRHMRAAQAKSRQILQKIISSPTYGKILQETIITQRDGRFVVPVKAEHKGDLPGLVHDISSSGATLFVEPMGVVQANNELIELEAKEQQEIERILADLSAQAAAHREDIQWDYDTLVHLDVIFARGQLSYRMDGVRPLVRRDGAIHLRKARHPLLDPKTAVPIDIELGGAFDTLVITGPNTGGKTVSLKTLGLLTLMTQCGLHIPVADRSEISVYERVLADIGDEQSIEQSLSTFSAHMVNIVAILKEADDNTLILYDELGAGTDPVEGAALAAAIIEDSRSLGALVAATTHYADLKVYAMTTRGVENASCEFNVDTLAPTYRLVLGIPGRSNAFAISRRLGLPENVIEKAAARLDAENVRFEDVLTKLDQQRQEMEKEREQARKLKLEMEQSAAKAREYRQRLEQERDKAMAKAQAEARAIIDEARAASDLALAELKEVQKRQDRLDWQQVNDSRAEARRLLNEAERNIGGSGPEIEAPPATRPAVKGDTVELVKMGTRATVLSVNKDGVLQLQAGILNITAKQDEVRVVEGETDTQKQARKIIARAEHTLRTAAVPSQIDLRGMMTDEAVAALENFLDTAMMGKLESVTIIHGKGTGAVRSAVRTYLKRSRYVKTFRPGRYGEGEDGVTVVELK